MPTHTIDIRALVQVERDRSVQTAREGFDELLAWIQGPAQTLSLFRAEKELLGRLFKLGVMLVGVWLATHLPNEVPRQIRSGHGWYHYRAIAADVVRTRFGSLRAARPVYALSGGKGPTLLAPEDRAIGLCSGRMSLGVHLVAGWLAARTTFDDVGETLQQLGGYAPSKRAVQGIVDELGPLARRWLQTMPAPDEDGEVLVVQVDGKGGPDDRLRGAREAMPPPPEGPPSSRRSASSPSGPTPCPPRKGEALFDVMSTGLADVDEADVRAHADALRQAFYARMEDPRFIKAITWGPNTPQEVRTRFDAARTMLAEVLGAS